MTPDSQEKRSSGMVLILVVVLLGLIVALVLQGQAAARAALRLEETRLRSARIRAALVDAVENVLKKLADDELLQVDHLEEEWVKPVEIRHPSGVSVVVRVTDENRFFDMNNLFVEQPDDRSKRCADILMDIMTLCEDFTPVERVQALRDWIDPDEEGFRESGYYSRLKEPYVSPNRWMESRSELPWVSGYTRDYFRPRERYDRPELFQADLEDCLTVLPGRRSRPVRINVNTASREVLLGVAGLELEAWVQYILVLRIDAPLVSLDAVASAADPLLVDRIRPYLDVKSSHFSVTARGYEDGQVEELWALVRRKPDNGETEVLRWVY